MDKGEIAANLKEIRKEKSLTQRNLVDNFEFSEVQVSNIERKKSNPRAKTLINMANSLDVPLSQIVDKNYNAKNNIENDEKWLGDLKTSRTLLLLKILEKIKEKLEEYKADNGSDEYMVAEEIDYGAVGRNITKLREEKKIDRKTMSKRMLKRSGMKEGTYRNIESNNGIVSMASYMEIADELDVTVDYIFEESLHNKEAISREYISHIFEETDDTERKILREMGEKIKEVLDKYYI